MQTLTTTKATALTAAWTAYQCAPIGPKTELARKLLATVQLQCGATGVSSLLPRNITKPVTLTLEDDQHTVLARYL